MIPLTNLYTKESASVSNNNTQTQAIILPSSTTQDVGGSSKVAALNVAEIISPKTFDPETFFRLGGAKRVDNLTEPDIENLYKRLEKYLMYRKFTWHDFFGMEFNRIINEICSAQVNNPQAIKKTWSAVYMMGYCGLLRTDTPFYPKTTETTYEYFRLPQEGHTSYSNIFSEFQKFLMQVLEEEKARLTKNKPPKIRISIEQKFDRFISEWKATAALFVKFLSTDSPLKILTEVPICRFPGLNECNYTTTQAAETVKQYFSWMDSVTSLWLQKFGQPRLKLFENMQEKVVFWKPDNLGQTKGLFYIFKEFTEDKKAELEQSHSENEKIWSDTFGHRISSKEKSQETLIETRVQKEIKDTLVIRWIDNITLIIKNSILKPMIEKEHLNRFFEILKDWQTVFDKPKYDVNNYLDSKLHSFKNRFLFPPLIKELTELKKQKNFSFDSIQGKLKEALEQLQPLFEGSIKHIENIAADAKNVIIPFCFNKMDWLTKFYVLYYSLDLFVHKKDEDLMRILPNIYMEFLGNQYAMEKVGPIETNTSATPKASSVSPKPLKLKIEVTPEDLLKTHKLGDIIDILSRLGFKKIRTKGSHETWKNTETNKVTTVPNNNKDLKPGTIRSIYKHSS